VPHRAVAGAAAAFCERLTAFFLPLQQQAEWKEVSWGALTAKEQKKMSAVFDLWTHAANQGSLKRSSTRGLIIIIAKERLKVKSRQRGGT
jgi:hypothetical protein